MSPSPTSTWPTLPCSTSSTLTPTSTPTRRSTLPTSPSCQSRASLLRLLSGCRSTFSTGRSQGSQSTCLRTRNQRSTRRSGSKQPLSCLMILLASFVFSSGFLLWATSWAASLPGSVFSLSLRSMQTEVAGSEFSQVSSILIRSCKVAWAISSLKVATTCDKAC